MPFPWVGRRDSTRAERPKNSKRRSSGFLSSSSEKKSSSPPTGAEGTIPENRQTNGVSATTNGTTNETYTNGTTAHTNGVYTNGVNGASAQPGLLSRATTFLMPDHTHHRSDVESVFGQYADVLKASMRPMPTAGDGQYHQDKKEHSSLWADLKTLGIGDMKTLKESLQQKATGALIDDKTYMVKIFHFFYCCSRAK